MRILVISQYFYPENFRINDLCIGLKELGHSVSVLTAKPNYPKGQFNEGYNFYNKSIDEYIVALPAYPSYMGTTRDGWELLEMDGNY